MAVIYISAGSNRGNSIEYLTLAQQLLAPAVRVLRTSKLYLTEPWGYKEQPPFINLVWEAETQLEPQALLRYFKQVENRLGRVKTLRYGPRVIDLDILLYDDLVLRSPDLNIPHLQMPVRRFVLQPLCDLIPDRTDPVSGKPWSELLSSCPPDSAEVMDTVLHPEQVIFKKGLRPYMMGIINLTPDSFSGDGLQGTNVIDLAQERCDAYIRAGVDIIDLGAESTRPGAKPVSALTEKRRLLPTLKILRETFPGVLFSVDSGKAEVVRAALDYGIDWINNTGPLSDGELNQVCAGSGKMTVLMRSKPLLLSPDEVPTSEEIGGRVRVQLMHAIDVMERAGMEREKMILDPGIGFNSRSDLDADILRQLGQIRDIGLPILVGASRKSFIGKFLQQPAEARLAGSAAAAAAALHAGADILRIHDPEFMTAFSRMLHFLG